MYRWVRTAPGRYGGSVRGWRSDCNGRLGPDSRCGLAKSQSHHKKAKSCLFAVVKPTSPTLCMWLRRHAAACDLVGST